MGLLTVGTPLSWEETKKLADHVRRHGILQFINIYHKLKDHKKDQLKWGDEIEYILVRFDDKNQRAQLALRASEVLPQLQEKEHQPLKDGEILHLQSLWEPEYAAYMIEGIPGEPFGSSLSCFNQVERNMRHRRQFAQKYLHDDEVILCFTAFPRLGCPDFTYPPAKVTPTSGINGSLFYPDEAIFSGHPRFRTLTRNVRQRRHKKVVINVPIFKDKNTPSPFKEDFGAFNDDPETVAAAKADHIYMDAMGFGMGCCCLQVTFQASSIDEARFLYDQLTVLCPIMLALSAASPIYRGKLADVDCRWDVIAASVDDRTDEEKGITPLTKDHFHIPKSRYDSVDSYISPLGNDLNDVKLVLDEDHLKTLLDAGVDLQLARHIAHLFIRDPISLFLEKIDQDDENQSDHFENIQSTNWQSMRFKPPPPHSNIGWRVEFRPMEIQMTDFENAALAVFIVLLTRVIISYKLNFLIPISKVEENMKEGQKRGAAQTGQFYFRKDVLASASADWSTKTEFSKMSINEIFNGKEAGFPGLMALIQDYLQDVDLDLETNSTIQTYLRFIGKKASGHLQTTATWIRTFVQNHSDYKHDSVVSEKINYDLMKTCHGLAIGDIFDPNLLIKHSEQPSRTENCKTSESE